MTGGQGTQRRMIPPEAAAGPSNRDMRLPPLPPGSALRFSDKEGQFPSLLSNLEGEMSRLLEWANAADATQRRNPAAAGVTHTAEIRQEKVRDFLKGRADVHQRRAKRREISESTAVKLPREAAGLKPRGGTQSEVSYLSDGPAASAAHGTVPASMIPDAFRIVLESPLPMREPNFYSLFSDDDWSYNASTRQFEAVLFPSKVPAGRRDVLLLHTWVNDMISRLKQTSRASEEETLKDAQLLFSVAFHEIIRQVSVHCLERGYLMGKIWWSEMELFQRLLQMRRDSDKARDEERAKHASEVEQLRQRVEELEAQLKGYQERESEQLAAPKEAEPAHPSRGRPNLDDFSSRPPMRHCLLA